MSEDERGLRVQSERSRNSGNVKPETHMSPWPAFIYADLISGRYRPGNESPLCPAERKSSLCAASFLMTCRKPHALACFLTADGHSALADKHPEGGVRSFTGMTMRMLLK